MIDETGGHAAFVAAWFERAARGLPAERLLDLLELACAALWARVCPTLGEVTLAAIAERVFHDAAERFPVLASIEVGLTGVRFEGPRAQGGELRADEVASAARSVLADFLTVLGHLTAEALTPALHATLAGVTLGAAAPGAGRGPGRDRGKRRAKP
ncbi:MAG TPA: hypothetical protein VFS43_47220 [Polyangiaceae bacterium]|nr:hypothetical protein [Polyangiaceae bacterium]